MSLNDMKKILLLTDFSEASHHALQYARSFFSDTAVDFHLLCIYPVEPDSFYSQKHVATTARTAFNDQLHELATNLRHEAINDWHTFRSSALAGNLTDVVAQVTGAELYDYVVLGAKKGGTNELFGNSATALVRQLKTNVLVVPIDAVANRIRQVVLAADFGQLKNCAQLVPVKELVLLKRATLTLLTIDTPGKKETNYEREVRVQQFLAPLNTPIARLQAPSVRQGISLYLDGHSVDLLAVIPKHKGWTETLAGQSITRSLVYTPPVPLLTLYDNGSSDEHYLIDDLSNLDCAL